MRFAEVFLRLGTSLVAWMMLYAYMVWLAVLFRLGCSADGSEMHALLLGMAPASCAFAALLKVTRTFPEVHAMLRWLAFGLLLLLPFAAYSVWGVLETVSLGGSAICSAQEPSGWQKLWVPVQIIALAWIGYVVAREYRWSIRALHKSS